MRLFLHLIGLLLLTAAVAGCSLFNRLPPILATATPAPEPTPLGDMVQFLVPGYRVDLQQYQTAPGTRLQFTEKVGDAFRVSIDGKFAEKRAGDSFPWRGIVAPGLFGEYDLSLLPTRDNSLSANGRVTLMVLSPQPVEAALPQRNQTPLVFRGIAVDELVPLGRVVPGTTLVFEAQTADGVRFSGTQTLADYRVGDSLVWRGLLRDNIFVDFSLKVVGVETHGLRLTGTAVLTAFPAPFPGQ